MTIGSLNRSQRRESALNLCLGSHQRAPTLRRRQRGFTGSEGGILCGKRSIPFGCNSRPGRPGGQSAKTDFSAGAPKSGKKR